MISGLSSRQIKILNYIVEELESKGYAPSVREMCEHVGLKSTSTVQSHLNTLAKKGFIRRCPTKPRAITVLHRNVRTGLEPIFCAENGCDLPSMPRIKGVDLDGFFNSFLLTNPNIVIYKNRGNSLINAGIFNNDYVIVDTSKSDIDNEIVVAVVNDEYSTIKRFIKCDDMVKLACDNGSNEFIFINPKNIKVIGVVTGFFRNFNI